MKHELKTCPRCGCFFECKSGDVANCECNIPLLAETRNFLLKTYSDCLCSKCLKHINELVGLSKNYKYPKPNETLIENVHYYKEGEFIIFTELYHLLRGYCCKNGCRHCVYGFKKI